LIKKLLLIGLYNYYLVLKHFIAKMYFIEILNLLMYFLLEIKLLKLEILEFLKYLIIHQLKHL